MAGISQGASAPKPFPFVVSVQWTRSRRYHGAFLLGTQQLRVYSSRRQADFDPIIVELGEGPMLLTGRMTTVDARCVAQALVDAVQAVDLEATRSAQRGPAAAVGAAGAEGTAA